MRAQCYRVWMGLGMNFCIVIYQTAIGFVGLRGKAANPPYMTADVQGSTNARLA